MVLPPVGRDGVDRESADSLADSRVPRPFYRDLEYRYAHPVGSRDGRLSRGVGVPSMVPGPCNPTGEWAGNRHLFDALMAEEGDVYEGDDLAPTGFQLTLTCVRCGLVKALTGKLDPYDHNGGGERTRGFIDPVPLQVGELAAQQISYDYSWGHENAQWTVYRDGRMVGWIATERGPRGAHYYAGGLGRRYVDDHVVVKGNSALAVLRKLAKQPAEVLV